MDLSVILTYRCDSRCSMCYIWKNPTKPSAEVTLETLEKLPGNRFDYLNVVSPPCGRTSPRWSTSSTRRR
jgi:MoaA/NifB/PqqE/SkfB family radical SAM enzyme